MLDLSLNKFYVSLQEGNCVDIVHPKSSHYFDGSLVFSEIIGKKFMTYDLST